MQCSFDVSFAFLLCGCCCRYLLGVTDEERQERRDQVLGTTQKDFREFAEVLDCVRGDAARVVAVTNADKAAQVLQERPGFWEVRKVL
jgi:Zn-dependent M16 (insulinase) family peptidase